jgi:hypothetical protein
MTGMNSFVSNNNTIYCSIICANRVGITKFVQFLCNLKYQNTFKMPDAPTKTYRMTLDSCQTQTPSDPTTRATAALLGLMLPESPQSELNYKCFRYHKRRTHPVTRDGHWL